MQALEFWKAITMDSADALPRFVRLLERTGIRYCVIGGQGVNAYVAPLVSLNLDLVVAADQRERLEALLPEDFVIRRFTHSINIEVPGSALRIQLQTDPRYFDFVDRATRREILGLNLPVASLEDLLRGKVWAAQDPARRGSKRQKDLADIARILEDYPELRPQVPDDILSRLL